MFYITSTLGRVLSLVGRRLATAVRRRRKTEFFMINVQTVKLAVTSLCTFANKHTRT